MMRARPWRPRHAGARTTMAFELARGRASADRGDHRIAAGPGHHPDGTMTTIVLAACIPPVPEADVNVETTHHLLGTESEPSRLGSAVEIVEGHRRAGPSRDLPRIARVVPEALRSSAWDDGPPLDRAYSG